MAPNLPYTRPAGLAARIIAGNAIVWAINAPNAGRLEQIAEELPRLVDYPDDLTAYAYVAAAVLATNEAGGTR